MIWNSVPLMTAVDLVIMTCAAVGIYCVFKHKAAINKLGLHKPICVIVCGMLVIAAVYGADLFLMHIMPLYAPRQEALDLMMKLHLNGTWLAVLIGIACIVLGLAHLLVHLFPQVAKSIESLEEDIGAHGKSERELQEIGTALERQIADRTEELQQAVADLESQVAERKESETARHESEARYQHLFEKTPVAIWEEDWSSVKNVLDDLRKRGVEDLRAHLQEHPEDIVEGFRAIRIGPANETAMRIFRLPSREAMQDLADPQRWAAEELIAWYDMAAGLARGQTEFEGETRGNAYDGSQLEMSYRAVLMPEGQGDWHRVLFTVMDITDRKQAERELAETTSLLNGIVEAVHLMISVKDPEGRYVLVNPECERAFRRSADELIGMTMYDVWPEKYAALQVEQERRAIELRKPVQEEKEAPLADGSLGTYLTVKIPVFDPDGGLIAMGTISTDITERKAAEERFHRYFELPLVGSAIYTPEKRWIQINDKLCDLLGYNRKEMQALTWDELTHPDDLAENIRLFDEALAGVRDTYSMDKRFIRKDGETVYTAISVQCLRRPDRTVDYFILLVQDITERRRAEQALQESEASFRQIAENINQVLYLYEPDLSRTIYINPAYEEIYGLSCEGMYADPMHFLKAVDPGDRDRVEAAQAGQLRGDYDLTYQLLRSDGSRRWVRDRAFPVSDLQGTHNRIVGIVEDVTDRKLAEDALKRLNEALEQRVDQRTAELRTAQEELVRKERLAALGQLTGTVSHELRNPLGAMRTSVAAIKKLAPDDQPLLNSSIAIVDRSITRCDNIIADLLDYSRVRPLELELAPVDRWLMEQLEEYKVPPGISLVRELESGAVLQFDHDRLARVLVNLLDNACQAMLGERREVPESVHVLTVASRQTGQAVEISIRDTGAGIEPDILEKIFEPLYSTKAFGVGLGLSIVKRIVEQHEGTVSVERAPGRGTRFVVRLPLKVPIERAAS